LFAVAISFSGLGRQDEKSRVMQTDATIAVYFIPIGLQVIGYSFIAAGSSSDLP
jgi:hypothetical protein